MITSHNMHKNVFMQAILPYAGILCPVHGEVDITESEYDRQMNEPSALWKCPKCRNVSLFDDKRWDEIHRIGKTVKEEPSKYEVAHQQFIVQT